VEQQHHLRVVIFGRNIVPAYNSRVKNMQPIIGLLAAIVIAYAAYRAHALDRSGMFAAMIIGTVIFGVGGWQWTILLLTFFITSSGLTRAFKDRKRDVSEKFSKGGQRDAGQVFGNGGFATLFAGLHYFFPNALWAWIAFAVSLAAVNADTWGTELGVLSPTPPRMISNLRKIVEKGTSGGISLVGSLAAFLGSALIALLAVLLAPGKIQTDHWSLFLLITTAGLLGSFFDSFLGATVQAIYYCPLCNKETERHPLHTCSAQTTLKRGWPWLNNDLVNVGCGLFAIVFIILTGVLY
jgi:uncharacterized protein (TIGR00297 family)